MLVAPAPPAAEELVAEPSEKPTILPTNVEKKPVAIANANAWASLVEEESTPAAAAPQGDASGGGSLWSQFQEKDSLAKQRAEEKKREEEREKVRMEQEAARLAKEKEEQVALQAQRERDEAERVRQAEEEERRNREKLREQEAKEREEMQQSVNMDSDRMVRCSPAHQRIPYTVRTTCSRLEWSCVSVGPQHSLSNTASRSQTLNNRP